MKRVGLFLCLGILLMCSAACGVGECEEPIVTGLPEFSYYSDSSASFWYPDNWVKDEATSGYTYLGATVLAKFDAPEECAGYQATCNLLSEIPYDVVLTSVEQYYQLNELSVKFLDGYKPICKEEITINGMEAIKVIYDVNFSGERYRQMQIYLVENQTGWVFTLQCAPECWDQYEYTFYTMADSLQL